MGGGVYVCGAKGPEGPPEPVDAICSVPPARCSWALSAAGLFPQRVLVSSLARPVGAEGSRA